MAPRNVVVYDACVLYPAPLRDFLMHLAMTDLFRACWTDRIHDEWIGKLLKVRRDLQPVQLQRTRSLMNAHVRDALICGFEHLIPAITLPDPDDRHVVAAAIQAGANMILTFNLSDFPASELQRYGVTAQHPDDFIIGLLACDHGKVSEAAAHHRRSLRNPPKTVDQYLENLRQQGLLRTAAALKHCTAI